MGDEIIKLNIDCEDLLNARRPQTFVRGLMGKAPFPKSSTVDFE